MGTAYFAGWRIDGEIIRLRFNKENMKATATVVHSTGCAKRHQGCHTPPESQRPRPALTHVSHAL